MKHGQKLSQALPQTWLTLIRRQLLPEDQHLLYLRYIEGFDTAALAEALPLRPALLAGAQGRLQEAEHRLLEVYQACQTPETLLPALTLAELVPQLFPPPPTSLPADFAAGVFAQVVQLRHARERRATAPIPASGEPPAPDRSWGVSVGSLGGLLWASPIWHPALAGEPVAAAGTSAQTHRFSFPYGEIQATCEWRAAYRDQPAMLRLAWRTHGTLPGELRVRFVRQEDPAALLSEFSLGSAPAGEVVLSARTLGFDPSLVPWSLGLHLTEPQPGA